MSSEKPVIETSGLTRYFGIRKAVDGVTFSVQPGKTLGLVGESGCGKTTVGRTILRLIPATGGSVRYKGEDFFAYREDADLGLRVTQAVLRRLHGLLRQLAGRLDLGEVLRDFQAQLVVAVACIDPRRGDRDRERDGKRDSKPPPRVRRLARRGRHDRRWRASFVLGIRHGWENAGG